MPEGDTILRAARTLERALVGKTIARVETPLAAVRRARLEGRRVVAVRAIGKNLLFDLDDGRVVHSHMRMTGSWHLYRPGERWRKSPGAARLVLDVGDLVAVCFSAPVVEVAAGAAKAAALATLGPDVLGPAFDPDDVLPRWTAETPIGEALLDQRAVAGIGNIYKSESLFLAGIEPLRAVGAIPPASLRSLLVRARKLMQANLETPTRTTRATRALAPPGARGRHWVYGRAGEPCHRCGAAIRMRRQGAQGRSSYWCPRCQPPAVPSPEAPGGGRPPSA